MRKPSKNLVKVVAGLTAISPIVYSCQETYNILNEELSDEGLSAISMDLKEDELQYISLYSFQKLSTHLSDL